MDIRDQKPHEEDLVQRVIADAFADGGQLARVWASAVVRKIDRASIVAVE